MVQTKVTPIKKDKKEKIDLPKAELIQGEIDFPEMIKQDFRKAMTIIALSVISTIVFMAAAIVLAFFV